VVVVVVDGGLLVLDGGVVVIAGGGIVVVDVVAEATVVVVVLCVGSDAASGSFEDAQETATKATSSDSDSKRSLRGLERSTMSHHLHYKDNASGSWRGLTTHLRIPARQRTCGRTASWCHVRVASYPCEDKLCLYCCSLLVDNGAMQTTPNLVFSKLEA
jgi:hypothetical protein